MFDLLGLFGIGKDRVGRLAESGSSCLFGLITGQRHERKVFSNAGWYNVNGLQLGDGDLDKADLREIMDGLQDDEVFVILHEDDCYWALPGDVDPNNVGKSYLTKYANGIVTRDGLYWVNLEGRTPMRLPLWVDSQTMMVPITPREARRLLGRW